MAFEEILFGAEEKMAKTEEFIVHEFAAVRTGKASTGLVENIMVEVYGGSHMRIRELASITTPEPRTIAIQPWDASTRSPVGGSPSAARTWPSSFLTCWTASTPAAGAPETSTCAR